MLNAFTINIVIMFSNCSTEYTFNGNCGNDVIRDYLITSISVCLIDLSAYLPVYLHTHTRAHAHAHIHVCMLVVCFLITTRMVLYFVSLLPPYPMHVHCLRYQAAYITRCTYHLYTKLRRHLLDRYKKSLQDVRQKWRRLD